MFICTHFVFVFVHNGSQTCFQTLRYKSAPLTIASGNCTYFRAHRRSFYVFHTMDSVRYVGPELTRSLRLCLQMFGCGAVAQLVLSGGSHGMFLTVNFAFGFAATLGILVCGQVSGKQSLSNLIVPFCFSSLIIRFCCWLTESHRRFFFFPDSI